MKVVDAQGKVLPAVIEVMKICAKQNLVLNTGHSSASEVLALIKTTSARYEALRAAGKVLWECPVSLVVTFYGARPNADIDNLLKSAMDALQGIVVSHSLLYADATAAHGASAAVDGNEGKGLRRFHLGTFGNLELTRVLRRAGFAASAMGRNRPG